MEKRIQDYARLLIKMGLNVQQGQNVVISAPVECVEFARLCARAAYNAGCREVLMNWSDDGITRLKYLYADEEIFDEYPAWTADFYNTMSAQGAAWLAIHASDPESMKGVDPVRMQRTNLAAGKALEDFRKRQMTNYYPWCVASVPTRGWAQKVFPHLQPDQAMDALWKAILDATRVTGDPIAQWEAHIQKLAHRKNILTEYQFQYLHYRNGLGTDLRVELPQDHVWEGGSEVTANGTVFCANMPTEEVFTAPKRDGVNGKVVASKPLVLSGNIVEDFSLTLQNGKIVDVQAKCGKEFLEREIELDEGAAYLGEVALVPYDSPISNSGILFYNTLFDENASCHFAFGEAYPCVRGGAKMSKEELEARGLNMSMTHVDFMVGTKDLSILGITHDGKEVPVFQDGNFVI